jgi:hypothetical protein
VIVQHPQRAVAGRWRRLVRHPRNVGTVEEHSTPLVKELHERVRSILENIAGLKSTVTECTRANQKAIETNTFVGSCTYNPRGEGKLPPSP